MYEFRTTDYDIEYAEFNPPLEVPKGEVLKHFPDGGAILYTDYVSRIKVKLYIRNVPGQPKSQWAKFIRRTRLCWNQGKTDYCPLEQMNEMVYLEEPLVLKGRDLAYKTDEFQHEFEKYAKRCNVLHNTNYNDIKIFYEVTPEASVEESLVCIYGYGYGDVYEKEPYERIIKPHSGIRSIVYSDYIQMLELAYDIACECKSKEDSPKGSSLRNERKITTVSSDCKVRKEISYWLSNTSYPEFYKTISSSVIGQENLRLITVEVYKYLKCVAYGRESNSRILLAAPSGCGKTETCRAIEKYFKDAIPKLTVFRFDISRVTEEGFRGADFADVLTPLLEKQENEGIGIVFMDEFDKKLLPSYSFGGADVNAAVMSQVLTIVEGSTLTVEKKSEGIRRSINTGNTMFVGMGSFDYFRKQRKDENKQHIGFGECEGSLDVRHYDDITKENMISMGASYELLGRFPMVINYHELSEECVDMIIDMQVDRISKDLGYDVGIGEDMRQALHEEANGKYGCRALYNKIYEDALRCYEQILLSDERRTHYEIIIDAPGEARIISRTEEDACA